jgi:hypothetical protein
MQDFENIIARGAIVADAIREAAERTYDTPAAARGGVAVMADRADELMVLIAEADALLWPRGQSSDVVACHIMRN